MADTDTLETSQHRHLKDVPVVNDSAKTVYIYKRALGPCATPASECPF